MCFAKPLFLLQFSLQFQSKVCTIKRLQSNIMSAPPAYQARFMWKPSIVRPPGKAVRIEELPTNESIESVDKCPPETTSNCTVASILAATGSDAFEVIRPPGRIVRVGAAGDDPVLSATNCPGHEGCMCCLLLKIDERLSQSAVVLNELYRTLLPMRAQQLQLDMAYDGEDLEALESADSVYGSSEDLDHTDDSLNSDVSTEDYLSR